MEIMRATAHRGLAVARLTLTTLDCVKRNIYLTLHTLATSHEDETLGIHESQSLAYGR